MPSTDGGDDFVGICGLWNGLENGDLIFEGAAPGGLEVGDRAGGRRAPDMLLRRVAVAPRGLGADPSRRR